MKKLIIIGLLACTSCASKQYVYQSTKVNKSIHNLELMMKWLKEDYVNGDIPIYVVKNYYIVLENTRVNLEQMKKKYKDEKL